MNDVRFEVHNLLINARAQSERQGNSFVPGARKTPGTNHLCTIEFLRHSNVRCDNQDLISQLSQIPNEVLIAVFVSRHIRKWRWLHEQCDTTRLVSPFLGILLLLAEFGRHDRCGGGSTAAAAIVTTATCFFHGARLPQRSDEPRPRRRSSGRIGPG